MGRGGLILLILFCWSCGVEDDIPREKSGFDVEVDSAFVDTVEWNIGIPI